MGWKTLVPGSHILPPTNRTPNLESQDLMAPVSSLDPRWWSSQKTMAQHYKDERPFSQRQRGSTMVGCQRLCLHGCVHWLLLEPDTQLQQLAITVIARQGVQGLF